MEEIDDKDKTLQQLAQHCGRPLIDLIIDIQGHQERRGKDLTFIQNLECFYARTNSKRKRDSEIYSDGFDLRPHTSLLRSGPVNAYEEPNYVAVSWCWTLPGDKSDSDLSKSYEIEAKNGQRHHPKIRDRVLNRILRYMKHFDVDLLWIDMYSISQHACNNQHDCNHDAGIQMREGLQAMDLVYKHSKHPVGLLELQLQNKADLDLLALLLGGIMVDQSSRYRRFWLSDGIDINIAKSALELVWRIINDPWWKRAWIFQENYHGALGMTLLLGHPPSLERLKKKHGFGGVPEELCISSVEFSYEATRLCLALRSSPDLKPDDEGTIRNVLSAAGRYTILLRKSNSMTPSIIADIEKRDITRVWDRIAITANCCKYSIRLNEQALEEQGHSLSLALLTMYLLNGEILYNCPGVGKRLNQCTVSQFIDTQAFRGFRSPGDKNSLTFNKGCRFTDVELTQDGILTKGHLWELGAVLDTATFSEKLPWIDQPDGILDLHERRRLLQLANKLRLLSHTGLAKHIELLLEKDAESATDNESMVVSFSQEYMRRMAAEIVASIDEGKQLRLGYIPHLFKKNGEYNAIFTWEEESYKSLRQGNEPDAGMVAENSPSTYVFTASWPRDSGWEEHDPNDLDRHVSLEVLVADKRRGARAPPLLYTRSWRPGLCFFKHCPREEVCFAWPPGLKDIVPEETRDGTSYTAQSSSAGL